MDCFLNFVQATLLSFVRLKTFGIKRLAYKKHENSNEQRGAEWHLIVATLL